MGSHRAFLVFMGRNFRARKEVGLPYPSTSGVRRLFARTGKSSPTLITHSRFETLPIPVGSPVHPSSTSDHMYLVECPCLPPPPLTRCCHTVQNEQPLLAAPVSVIHTL